MAEKTPQGEPTGRAMICRLADPQYPDYTLIAPEDRDPNTPLAHDVASTAAEIASA
jgi:hypothetical protein